MASSQASLTYLLAHCAAVKTSAIAAGANSAHCLTIARFLGKAILQLEALYQAEGVVGPSDDILGKVYNKYSKYLCSSRPFFKLNNAPLQDQLHPRRHQLPDQPTTF
jgi:hypothetical protein